MMFRTTDKDIHILTVCTGNICRSPMAAGILHGMFRQNPRVRISSAGTHAVSGNHATDFALIAAREQGIDIFGHRAKVVDRNIIQTSDIILCMESAHVELILSLDVSACEKTFNLAEFSDKERKLRNIADPYGCSIREYRQCFRDIEVCIRTFFAAYRKQD